ncbi:MAG: UDP-2,4-diacetamido-2,4,6-trideoxy-beta-L-altropyranose hydrolase [Gemmatimonadota bacterium]|nr:UDP-2,4-diacetamido-2,4,6-trideoxy-beta-L-altropyranose hydrolase [Gemmatimonadota bacterium]
MRRILIRVDATPEIGVGHLMRMVALGQLLDEHGYDVHFATIATGSKSALSATADNFTLHRISRQAPIGSPEDAAEALALAGVLSPSWIVLDGNAFGSDYQTAMKASGARVMSVDDLARGHFVSDVVLNQNYGAERLTYSTSPYTRKLLGTKHILLRREFREVDPASRRPHEPPNNILVSLGGGSLAGGDALRALIRVLAAVPSPGLRFHVAVGMLGVEPEELRALATSDPVRFQRIPYTGRMADEMRRADVAICSGGSTVWELIYMRVPFLAVALNEPQLEFLSTLERDGICVSIGSHLGLDAVGVRQTIERFLARKQLRDRTLEASEGLVDPRRSERELLATLATT